jgi:hypothetical protein
MICRDLDKSYAIILEEYLLELCISPFLTLLNLGFATQKRKGKEM